MGVCVGGGGGSDNAQALLFMPQHPSPAIHRFLNVAVTSL
jgi:hypothetical protein